MNSLALSLNEIFGQWKKQYDIFASITSSFAISNGFLCFDGHPLFSADELSLSSAEYDAESIQFFFTGNRGVNISISWPENLPPVVSSVSFLYILQSSKESEDRIQGDTYPTFT